MNTNLLETEYDFLRRLLYEQTSVALPPGKEYVAETRLVPVLTLFDCRNLADLVKRLRENPTAPLLAHVIDALTNHETTWLRDPGLFDALYTGALPRLVARRQRDRRLNIWSAACSTGQEPYSIAMLVDEQFPEIESWSVEIVSTDVSSLAVRRAQEGAYSNLEMQRGLPEPWRSRYFEPASGRWRVRDEIRKKVNFRHQNLLRGPLVRRYDLILLCNVLLYFDPDTRRRALARMERCLVKDGYLVLDRAMMTTGVGAELFETERFGSFEVYRPR